MERNDNDRVSRRRLLSCSICPMVLPGSNKSALSNVMHQAAMRENSPSLSVVTPTTTEGGLVLRRKRSR